MSKQTNRREFLQRFGLAAAGASMLPQLLRVKASFARTLAQMPAGPSGETDFDALRRAYSLAEHIVYFNHGSIGTIPKAVQHAHREYLRICESNPWLYMWGGEWESAREETRTKAAALLNCDAGEIALTHNTTEGFNLLAQGLPLGNGDEVLFSSLNHPGASICWHHMAAVRGFTVKQFPFPLQAVPEMTAEQVVQLHAEQISPRTRVLVFPHVDNMVGLRHPVRELTQMARQHGVRFVAVDGAQSVGMFPVDVTAAEVDFYATSPHKWLQAPKGLGLMYIRKDVQPELRPMWVTWGQNRWKGTVRIFEDYGTRNLPEALTLGDAIAFQNKLGAAAKAKRLQALRAYFRKRVAAQKNVKWLSPERWELGASLFAVEITGQQSTEAFQRLYRKHGFVFRPFHNDALNSLRISPNVFNTTTEIDRFFERIAQEYGS